MSKRWIALSVSLALIVGVIAGGFWLWERVVHRFTPERCTITGADGAAVSLTKEQSRMAAIIVAASFKAELPERAAVVALATAYQESDIRNLDHGDRDSLGLFQQRPDPKLGWGTAEQIRDPWYASLRFYEELVKFPDWETTDVNDQAQKVQRSGHPEAYRKHEDKATALAAALRGTAPRAVTCVTYTETPADPAPIEQLLSAIPGIDTTVTGSTLRVTSAHEDRLWAAAQLAQLQIPDTDVRAVQVGGWRWQRGDNQWKQSDGVPEGSAVIMLGD